MCSVRMCSVRMCSVHKDKARDLMSVCTEGDAVAEPVWRTYHVKCSHS